MSIKAAEPRHRFRCFACFLGAGYLCDWKLPNGGLCNRAICPDHSEQVGPNKHICPEHQEAWRAFRVARRERQEAQAKQGDGSEPEPSVQP